MINDKRAYDIIITQKIDMRSMYKTENEDAYIAIIHGKEDQLYYICHMRNNLITKEYILYTCLCMTATEDDALAMLIEQYDIHLKNELDESRRYTSL